MAVDFVCHADFLQWVDDTLQQEQDAFSQALFADVMKQLNNHRRNVIQLLRSNPCRLKDSCSETAEESSSNSSDRMLMPRVKDEGWPLRIPNSSHCAHGAPQCVHEVMQAEQAADGDSESSIKERVSRDLCNLSLKIQGHIEEKIGEKLGRAAHNHHYVSPRLNKLAGSEDDGQGSSKLAMLVHSHSFEIVTAALIVMNVLITCVEIQYQGLDVGYKLKMDGFVRPAVEIWPQFSQVAKVLHWLFNILFTVELVLRVIALKLSSFKSGWMWLDFLLVCICWSELIHHLTLIDPMTLRLFRLFRFLRLLRVLRAFKVVETLFLLVKSIQYSGTALLWSLSLIWILQVTVAITLCQILENFMGDDTKSLATRQSVFQYFGTMSNAILTMFEITFGNWVISCRFFHESVSEWFGCFYIFYRCCFLFAIMNVITAIFIAETNRVAASDDELAITKKQRAKDLYCTKLTEVFTELDASHDGYVSWEEFSSLVTDDLIKTWLNTLEIDTLDLAHLFQMLADEDNRFNVHEFVTCLSRVKGPAKSVDMLKVISTMGKVERKLDMFLESGLNLKNGGAPTCMLEQDIEPMDANGGLRRSDNSIDNVVYPSDVQCEFKSGPNNHQ